MKLEGERESGNIEDRRGMGGVGIGVATGGRGGTSVGTVGGIGIGGTSMGGMGGPIVTRPTPPDVKEVVFRGGIVTRADSGK